MNFINKLYYFVKQKIELYQRNNDLKRHLKILISVFFITCLLKLFLSYKLNDGFGYLRFYENEKNQAHAQALDEQNSANEQIISDNNDKNLERNVDQNNPQKDPNLIGTEKKGELILLIIDQIIHFLMSIEILGIIFLITLIINKKKEEPLKQILLLQTSSQNLCSIQIIGESPNYPSANNRYQSSRSSYELQTLSRQKPKPQNLLISIEENSIEANQSEKEIVSYKQLRTKQKISVFKCEKQNCKFFWFAKRFQRNYFCLNCDQNNQIDKTNLLAMEIVMRNNQSSYSINLQPYILKKKTQKLVVECKNFHFCGFYWIFDYKYDRTTYYCPICCQQYNNYLPINRIQSSISNNSFEQINYMCCFCQDQAISFFQTSCCHIYHEKCLEQYIITQCKSSIPCIVCQKNLLNSLIQIGFVSQPQLEIIYQNQLETLVSKLD